MVQDVVYDWAVTVGSFSYLSKELGVASAARGDQLYCHRRCTLGIGCRQAEYIHALHSGEDIVKWLDIVKADDQVRRVGRQAPHGGQRGDQTVSLVARLSVLLLDCR